MRVRFRRLEEAATAAGRCVTTIRGRIARGEIPAVREGGRILVDVEAARELFRARPVKAAAGGALGNVPARARDAAWKPPETRLRAESKGRGA